MDGRRKFIAEAEDARQPSFQELGKLEEIQHDTIHRCCEQLLVDGRSTSRTPDDARTWSAWPLQDLWTHHRYTEGETPGDQYFDMNSQYCSQPRRLQGSNFYSET